MASNAKRGAYYKAKTKKRLIAMGYQVADMEMLRTIRPGLFQKIDQFGADLLAMNQDRVVFVQVKGGKTAVAKSRDGARAFSAFVFPPFVSREVWAWPLRARQPIITSCH